MRLILLFLLLGSGAQAQTYTKVKITDDFTLWSKPNFSSSDAVNSLLKGTEAEIINYVKKSQGYGVEVRITTGPQKGQTGWVYYHLKPEKRKMSFLDDKRKAYSKITEDQILFMDHFASQQEKIKDYKKKISLLPVNKDDITDLDKVLENIKNGIYVIDSNQEDGGTFLPVLRTVQDVDGTKRLDTFYIPKSYSSIIDQIQQLNQGLYLNFGIICLKSSDEILNTNSKLTKGCEFLVKQPKAWNEEKLMDCIDSLRVKIGGNSQTLSRKTILQNMFKLEPEEQEYLGSILTLYGESRSSTNEEGLIIMQTFENRKRTAKEDCRNANILDVVLQSYQFSMWNNSDPNWKKAVSLKEEEKSPPIEISESYQLKRFAKIYKKFKTKDFHVAEADVPKIKKITHYRTRAMDEDPLTVPSWGTSRDSTTTIRVNYKNLGSQNKSSQVDHYFFEDVAWRFKYHPYRPRRQGEEKCY